MRRDRPAAINPDGKKTGEKYLSGLFAVENPD